MKKEKRRQNGKVFMIACLACGFWSVLYPEFAYHQDTVRVVTAQGEELQAFSYQEFLDANADQIRVRSKLYEVVAGFFSDR